MIDLPGPKIRLGEITRGPVLLKRGQSVRIRSAKVSNDPSLIPINYPDIHRIAKSSRDIFINDGIVKLSVRVIRDRIIECRVEAGGEISSHKGVNIPGGSFAKTAITARDRECIKFGIKHRADYFAMSFVRRAADLKLLRGLVHKDHGEQD